MKISPVYKMELITKVEKSIWNKYKSYKKVEQFMTLCIEDDGWGSSNFIILHQSDGKSIDLTQTLTHMDDKSLLKIAVEMGVNTPDIIPAVAEIENIFKVNYQTALETFQKALNQLHENPDYSISLANSALESIVKHILKDSDFKEFNPRRTLYDQTCDILKHFKLNPSKELPEEIKSIGSSLLVATQAIERLRSEKTNSHGKLKEDYIIKDSLYAAFVINTVATIGIFLKRYYDSKYIKKTLPDDILDPDDLPF